MWILTNTFSGEVFYLSGEHNKKYTVGRDRCDLVIRDDSSINRTHATFYCINRKQELLKIEDSGSKHGVYINDGIKNNNRIEVGVKVLLEDCDEIRFGRFQNTWRLNSRPFISALSMLSLDQATETEAILKSLGGKVQPSWDFSCTHLTMNEIVITVKVLYALLENKPIVTCQYWKDLANAVKSNDQVLPEVELYVPRYSDKIVNRTSSADFRGCTNRNRLFAGKTFIFLNEKHSELYAPIIRKAGGMTKCFKPTQKKTILNEKNSIVVQFAAPSDARETRFIDAVNDYLKKHDCRCVPEYEIGMSIINCSITKFCNPHYKVLSELMPESSSFHQTEARAILAPNTDACSSQVSETPLTTLLVPETMATVDSTEPMHLKLTESQEETVNVEVLMVPDTDDEDESMPTIQVTESLQQLQQSKRRRQPEEKDTDKQLEESQILKKSKKDTENANKTKEKEVVDSSKDKDMKGERKKTNGSGTDDDSENVMDYPRQLYERTAWKERKMPTVRQCVQQVIDQIEEKVLRKSSPIPPLPPNAEFAYKTNPERSVILLPRPRNSQSSSQSGFQSARSSQRSTKSKMSLGKRLHISVLSDDADDNDLFDFGDTIDSNQPNSKKLRTICSDEEDNSNDESISAFSSSFDKLNSSGRSLGTIQEEPDESEKSGGGDSVRKAAKPAAQSVLVMPRPKVMPHMVNVANWLSTNQSIMVRDGKLFKDLVKVKHEKDLHASGGDSSTNEFSDDFADGLVKQELNNWWDTLKGGFEARKCIMNVSRLRHSDLSDHQSSASDCENQSTVKNFKKFKKQIILPRRCKVIDASSTPVV